MHIGRNRESIGIHKEPHACYSTYSTEAGATRFSVSPAYILNPQSQELVLWTQSIMTIIWGILDETSKLGPGVLFVISQLQ